MRCRGLSGGVSELHAGVGSSGLVKWATPVAGAILFIREQRESVATATNKHRLDRAIRWNAVCTEKTPEPGFESRFIYGMKIKIDFCSRFKVKFESATHDLFGCLPMQASLARHQFRQLILTAR